jgi:hypothetical protein
VQYDDVFLIPITLNNIGLFSDNATKNAKQTSNKMCGHKNEGYATWFTINAVSYCINVGLPIFHAYCGLRHVESVATIWL